MNTNNSKRERQRDNLIASLKHRLKLGTDQFTVDQLEEIVAKSREIAEQFTNSHSHTISGDDEKLKLERLSDWIKVNAPMSGVGDAVEFKCGLVEGNGVFARKSMNKDSVFMQVPRHVMMTITSAADSKIGPMLVNDPMCLKIPSLILTMHLLIEARDSNSFWKPYIDCLPKKVKLPFCYSIEELKGMKGTREYKDVLKLARSVIVHFVHMFELFRSYQEFLDIEPPSWNEFQWAVCNCMARQNRIPSIHASGKFELCLIPGWDLCNYSDGYIATFFNPEEEMNVAHLMTDVNAGDQIFIYYGDRSNFDLFLYSGFVFEKHAHDSLKLEIAPFMKNENLWQMQKLFLSKRGLTFDGVNVFNLKDEEGYGDPDLLFYLQTCVMDKQDALFCMKNPSEQKFSNTCFKAALELLSGICEKELLKLSSPDSISQELSGEVKLIYSFLESKRKLFENVKERINSQLKNL
jgi:histone-lysine N-methyltransferase SETD3